MNVQTINDILKIVGEEAIKTQTPPFSKHTPEHNAEYCKKYVYESLVFNDLSNPESIAELTKMESIEAIHTVTGSSPCSWAMGEEVYKRVLELLKT